MKKYLKNTAVFTLGILVFVAISGFKKDFFEIAKQLEIFTSMFKEINMNYVDEVNPAHLMNAGITAMLRELDPYTVYWNEKEVQDAKMNFSAQYAGIGATISMQNNKMTIVESFKNYPADKAGLKAGDEIVKIDDIEVTNFKESSTELLKGAPNSTLNITYKRQGELFSTKVTLGSMEIKAVPFFKLLENNVGYIVLSKFSRNAASETASALKSLQNQGANKIILDLRGNPGGLLSEAILVSNLFLPQNQIITTTKSVVEKYNKTYKTNREPIAPDIPLTVLINGRSASASEIVAGSLQDLDRAVIIGARSFGKGLVQRPINLNYNTRLKITIARYYTPSGRCIQALNYRETDENGNAVRINKKDYHKFTTRNGRPVFDGGGILPDIVMKTSKYSPISKALLTEETIFNFATEYYYTHSWDRLEEFEFTDSNYSDFKKFLKRENFEFETETSKKLDDVLKTAKNEGIKAEIFDGYQEITAALTASEEKILDKNKKEIVTLLTHEIIKRYFYKEGLYNYYVTHNPEILKAKTLLNQPTAYQDILN